MGIELTSSAVGHIKSLFKEHSLTDHVVRVAINTEDFSYALDIVEGTNSNDRTFDVDGIKVVCDPRSYLYFDENTTIGFDSNQGGFTFDPPSIKP